MAPDLLNTLNTQAAAAPKAPSEEGTEAPTTATTSEQQQPLLLTPPNNVQAASVMAALRRTYDEEGFKALFRGACVFVLLCILGATQTDQPTPLPTPQPTPPPTQPLPHTGMGPELARGVLSAALMLMLKERLYTMNRGLLLRQRGPGKAYA